MGRIWSGVTPSKIDGPAPGSRVSGIVWQATVAKASEPLITVTIRRAVILPPSRSSITPSLPTLARTHTPSSPASRASASSPFKAERSLMILSQQPRGLISSHGSLQGLGNETY